MALREPGEALMPPQIITADEEGKDTKEVISANVVQKYKKDGVYEYALLNGRRDQARVKISLYVGDVYEGALSHGKYEGKGAYTWASGGKYEGDFRKNELSGGGKYTHPNGDVYEGSFVHGKYEGGGKYRWADGSAFEGLFKDGRMKSGQYTDASGKRYSIEFKYDRFGRRKGCNMKLVPQPSNSNRNPEVTASATEESGNVTTAEPPKSDKAAPSDKQGDNGAKKKKESALTSRDEKVLSVIRNSRAGNEFKELYTAKAGTSEAQEKKLINILNFFTNGDEQQMTRIFESSKQYNAQKGAEHVKGLVQSAIKSEASAREAYKSAQHARGRQNQSGATR